MSRILMRLPDPREVEQSHLADYMAWLGVHGYPTFHDYHSLYQWSVQETELFWESIWHWGKVLFHQPYSRVLADAKMPGAKWFEDAQLNFAENLLANAVQDGGREIIYTHRESARRNAYTSTELLAAVSKCAAFLRASGVIAGDRVAAVVCNGIEALVAMLATTSVGAIWSSCSPDFGSQGILDRFSQIEPKLILVTDGYTYGGKTYSRLDRISEILKNLPTVRHVIWISNIGEAPQNIPGGMNCIRWQDIQREAPSALLFTPLPFDHPVYIVYSSGTTGKPKCIMHGAGGVLLQHKKELMLHTNLQESDQLLYYTTTGWMMWNWMVSSLMSKCVLHLYDGAPNFPSLEAFWDLLKNEEITVFGTSAKFLSSCRSANLFATGIPENQKLKTILSTGSPLLPDDYDWVYRRVNSNVLLSSISGGTDIVSCFFLGNPLLPVYQGELQCRGLGMAVKAYDENGHAVVGQVGELVCEKPAPSMPVSFWQDPHFEKYRAAYFEKYPQVWSHGDFVKILEDGAAIIYGRSDATLNPGGVRIGTSEIYRQVETIEEIADSLVVSQPWQGDERIILFVVLKNGYSLLEDLVQKIRYKIQHGATPRHVPAKIISVSEIPYTMSGKKVELAVSRILRGQAVENRNTLANPDSLNQFLELTID